MKIFLFILAGLVVLFIGLATYVRVASVDPALWHVDPETAVDPGGRGVLTSEASDLPPEAALGALDTIILATPRSQRIAGDAASGMVTYEVRTKLMRYPDYVTIKAKPTEQGSDLVILSRARFGESDFGVNAARLDGWLAQFKALAN
jgi:hypothetical protein